ncbi:hypothetical protein BH18ACT1_BH18ACT1_09570 [soil metagenome]
MSGSESASASSTQEIVAPRTDELTTSKGETTIVPLVVAKVAREAAREVDDGEVAGDSGLRSLLARVRPGGSAGGTSASVASRRTALDLHVCVAYPRPVRSVTEQVRHHVRSRVQELTGYEVTDVDIVVDALPAPSRRRAGRVQ